MFEKTREVVRKDKYGFPEDEFPQRAVIMGSAHPGLSRKELSIMAAYDPILAGDVRGNASYDPSKARSAENFLFTVTVTADLLGGTRNLLFDGKTLYLVHGERKYSLRDPGLIRKRAGQLAIKTRELEKAIEALEQQILHSVAEVRTAQPVRGRPAIAR